ncbi:MAG: cobyrinic acid a,c-diamide synthase, partial [Sarcina sp.]|nr:cobyrinic acid a,c-diamide synthase [Sarcina sp.]
MRLLQKKGFSPVAFKCGPDYIDPMFHRQVLGIPSRNLDAFFSPDGQTLEILQKAVRKNKADIAIIEGVMGYFDGTGKTGMEASSFDLAMQTQTPVILLVNAKGMGRSIVSLIKGFRDYEVRAAEKLPILGAVKRAEKQAEKRIGELIEEP